MARTRKTVDNAPPRISRAAVVQATLLADKLLEPSGGAMKKVPRNVRVFFFRPPLAKGVGFGYTQHMDDALHTLTPSRRALARMKLKDTCLGAARSCTSLALAAFASPAAGSATWNTVTMGADEHCRPYAEERDVHPDGWYGLRRLALHKAYGSCGLEYTSALVDGERFPRTCILHLKNVDGETHAVARVDGTLVDNFDCRADKHGYQVIGFWK